MPTAEWKGQDAFIIGGGSSLKDFDFQKLKGRNTIGCNDAFRLGGGVVRICFFGDASWFQRVKWDLDKFEGRKATCAPTLLRLNLAWLLQMNRMRDGVGTGSAVGWNYSTGAASINLAVSLGSTRVFLLGFDLAHGVDGKSHWHTFRAKATDQGTFARFTKGFTTLATALGKLRPDVKVWNVTDGTSKLAVFPAKAFAELDSILA